MSGQRGKGREQVGGTEMRYDESDGGERESARQTRSARTEMALLEDETVLVDAQPTWWAWAGHLVVAAVIALVGIVLGDGIAVLSVLVSVAIAGYVWYRRSRVHYLITDRRIVVVAGFSARTTTETWMEDVRSMQTKASAFGRHQGYGTITVSHAVISQRFSRTSGLRLPGVPEYEHVAETIRRRQSERKAVEY
ncbi:PH domain-containing protein [Natronorubrum sediminis]|uniref:PH domain-containing protein n=1 Tax=Natronorubrum sediminis TaxID=640943 RepID=A0A1H6FQY8_9EURY|nr:PH domain-containing protein [Natronorubrum sediminis]SEH13329.1 PH domain-containing protein [Natronorubrum sediminis]